MRANFPLYLSLLYNWINQYQEYMEPNSSVQWFGKRPRFQEKWYFWPFVEFVADFCYFRQFLQISNISDNLWTRGGRKLCDQCFTFLKIFKIIFYSPCHHHHHHHHPNSWELSNIQKKESLLTSILRTLTDFKLQSSVWFLWFFLGKNINVKKNVQDVGWRKVKVREIYRNP